MSSLPVELLLGKLLVPGGIFPSFALVLLSLLTLIRRTNHDGQMLGLSFPMLLFNVQRGLGIRQRPRSRVEAELFFYLQSKADSEISVQVGSPPLSSPNPHPRHPLKGLQRALARP